MRREEQVKCLKKLNDNVRFWHRGRANKNTGGRQFCVVGNDTKQRECPIVMPKPIMKTNVVNLIFQVLILCGVQFSSRYSRDENAQGHT